MSERRTQAPPTLATYWGHSISCSDLKNTVDPPRMIESWAAARSKLSPSIINGRMIDSPARMRLQAWAAFLIVSTGVRPSK